MNLFLDTNAVIKLYHEEHGTDNLLNLIGEFENDVIITISDICKIEFHSAFLRRVRTREIERTIVEQVFQYFEQDLPFYHVIEVNDSIKQFATGLLDEIAWKKGLKTLDAIQLSSALISNRWLLVDYFVTADQKLLKTILMFSIQSLRADKNWERAFLNRNERCAYENF